MGIRRKTKNIKLSVEHYSSQLFINKIDICSNCPLKLYSKENDTIVFGTGNRVTNTMIILPSYDIKADINYNTILKIVRDTYKDITDKELLEDCYVTRAIKCVNKTDFNLEKEAIKNCICNLYYELSRIKPNKLIILINNYMILVYIIIIEENILLKLLLVLLLYITIIKILKIFL